MNTDALERAKTFLNVFWVVLLVSLVAPLGGLGTILRAVFALMVVAHLIEFAVFYRTLSRLGGSMGHHFVQTLLYGMFHLQLAKARAGQVEASS
jgi:uncharacterized protein YhhL (DUF1145 family)